VKADVRANIDVQRNGSDLAGPKALAAVALPTKPVPANANVDPK
jgi:hypothetical protein